MQDFSNIVGSFRHHRETFLANLAFVHPPPPKKWKKISYYFSPMDWHWLSLKTVLFIVSVYSCDMANVSGSGGISWVICLPDIIEQNCCAVPTCRSVCSCPVVLSSRQCVNKNMSASRHRVECECTALRGGPWHWILSSPSRKSRTSQSQIPGPSVTAARLPEETRSVSTPIVSSTRDPVRLFTGK